MFIHFANLDFLLKVFEEERYGDFMQRIVPHLWYDKEAKEAVQFYISLFDQSEILNETIIENTPSGDAMMISFCLAGQQFEAISAGPYFRFNPSISFMVACYSVDEINTKWNALSEGGTPLMPLSEYSFSKWYGWIQDKYGLSWQLMLMKDGEKAEQKITPNLLFSNDSNGKTEEAIEYYTELFQNSTTEFVNRYEEGEASSIKAKVNYAAFDLEGSHFSAMDNSYDVDYGFNEAFSFIIYCEDQQEIDYYWDKLSAVEEAEACGWIKDKYGVSWQIVPKTMKEIMKSGDRDALRRVTEAFLQMKKFDLVTIQKAYQGIL